MIVLLLLEILKRQAQLFEHRMKGSCLDLVLQIPDDREPLAEVQRSVASLPALRNEFDGDLSLPAELAKTADELGAFHPGLVSDKFVRLSSCGRVAPPEHPIRRQPQGHEGETGEGFARALLEGVPDQQQA